ncbi:Bacteriophage protein [Mycobacteroides abscessus subsp. massiliense]|nr:Bacteriophage protein [Mycobacteroides abscessus subsp. massiliense]
MSNPKVAIWLNDYALIDHVESGNGIAWVVSSALTIRQGMSKTMPKVSFTMTTRDGHPWVYGFDYLVGDRGLWEVDAIYYVDNIRGMKWSVSENSPMAQDLTIGKARDHDPFEAGMKALADGWNAIGSLIGGAAIAA